MIPNLFLRAAYWLDRAEEVRAAAEHVRDPQCRRQLLMIAEMDEQTAAFCTNATAPALDNRDPASAHR